MTTQLAHAASVSLLLLFWHTTAHSEAEPPSAPFVNGTALIKPGTVYYPHKWEETGQLNEDDLFLFLGSNQDHGFVSGVAARDINGDHLIDLASISRTGADVYLQQPGGQFKRHKTLEGGNAGPLFFDANQDGHIDLSTGEIAYVDIEKKEIVGAPRRRLWLGPDFVQSDDCQLPPPDDRPRNRFGLSAGDINLDGRLDLVSTNWDTGKWPEAPHLLINRGGCRYERGNSNNGVLGSFPGNDFSFTSTLSDLNNNGLPDLLFASDFETSQYFINTGNERFHNVTNPFVIDDKNGMGSAVADFDNDGLFDWFVTSVWDHSGKDISLDDIYGTWGSTGNRLYRNLGNGQFDNVSDDAGIGNGAWGWGTCAADFNNDGHLDIYHVNGFLHDDVSIHPNVDGKFSGKPSRLFINRGDGTFSEEAAQWGLDEPNEGRGVACFDHGRDGDIDIVYSQAYGETRLFLNQINDSPQTFGHYIGIITRGMKGNLAAAGAKVYVFPESGEAQVREILIGGNFSGQHPPEAHFGLGQSSRINTLLVQWPGKPARYSHIENLKANQWIVVNHPERVETGEPTWQPVSVVK